MRVRTSLCLLAAASLALAACGRDPDEFAGYEAVPPGARVQSTAPTASTTPGSAPGDQDGTAPAGGASGPGEAAGLDEGGFGDLGVVCSPGDGDPAPLPDEPGLDGTTIRVGTLADPGFAGRPGLNQEMHDAAEAVVEWCNEHGGVRGYRLEVDLLDSKLTEHQPRIVEACDQDWFLVGGGSVFDGDGQAARLACGLPDIAAFVVTPDAAEADLVVQPVPNPVYSLNVGAHRYLTEAYPDAIRRAGVMTGAIPTTRIVAARHREAGEALGWRFVAEQEYNPLGESNWKPFVQKMIDDGVEGLVYSGEPQNLAAIQAAMRDLDYEPAFILTDANHYDPTYIETGGDAIVNTFVYNYFWPLERAGENPATRDYLALLDEHGGKVALLGEQGLSAWLLFLTSTAACVDAGDVTRDCVYATAREVEGWTGGGLHAPTDPGTNEPSQCFLLYEASAEGFAVVDIGANEGIYHCDPQNRMALRGDYGTGARCPSGKEDPLPSECA